MASSDLVQLPEWKTEPKRVPNKLHSLCSYIAMFPPSIPNHFIQKYTDEGDVVLDPFSGRGTTPLEACTSNRIGIGNDRNPLAYVLTLAKVQTPSIGRISSKIEQLEGDYAQGEADINLTQEDWKIRMLFSDYTLKQLLFMKENLCWDTNNVDAFVTAMVLGILHGNSDGYLSIKMPNTFSMSPNYIRGYIAGHELERPDRNVFNLLRRKAGRCYEQPASKGQVYRSDARKLTKIRNDSVSLVMTSPPYTRVIRYGAFNWIRLWFLGKDAKEVDRKLLCTQSLFKYQEFMTGVLTETMRVLKSDGTAVFVIGDVKDRTSDKVFNLGQFVWENCAEPLGFELKEPIAADVISDDTKVSKIWGARRGNATKIDRVLVLSKS
ncbi:hypothetical protein AUJ14_03550 [Candidatus Micrarchaeota archaeon CG1_02_55_22]|nr:MAG: hypothetical protein AUJ14_03550 [Candidatus Micrarchaeota archaeon CG1_02_55_22]